MAIICKTCDKGELVQKKVHRMSTPVVVIGYIIAIPSALGALFFGVPLVITIIMAIFSKGADTTGAVIAGGVMAVFAVGSFVSGLIGWLLIMKKKVLVCTNCAATVAAQ